MDENIRVMSILLMIQNAKLSVNNKRIRHGRLILCLFKEDLISDSDYLQVIMELEKNGYVIIKGKLTEHGIDEECELTVTEKGEALISSVGRKIIGQTDYVRLEKLVKEYTVENESTYLQKTGARLKILHEGRKGKTKEVKPETVCAIGEIITIDLKNMDIFQTIIKLPQSIVKKPETIDWDINSLRNSLENYHKQPFHVIKSGDHLTIASTIKLEKVNFSGHELEVNDVNRVKQSEVNGWSNTVVKFLLEIWLRKIGYIRSGNTHRKFIKLGKWHDSITEAGNIREYDAIQIKYSSFEDNRIFLWVNSYCSFKKTIIEYLIENKTTIDNEQSILDALSSVKLKIEPSGLKRDLIRVIPNVNMEETMISNLGKTYSEFWKDRYNVVLKYNIQPILVLKGWGTDLNYPAEMVNIDRYDLEKQYHTLSGREPKHQKPEKRIEELNRLIEELKIAADNQLSDYIDVKFEQTCPQVKKLIDLDIFSGVHRIAPPLIEFARGEIRLDPMDVFSHDTEPVCGKKQLNITHVILPDNIRIEDVNNFIKTFDRRFNSYNLGSVEKARSFQLIRYNLKKPITELEAKIRSLEKIERHSNIGLSITPDNSKYYYSIKRLFPMRAGVPIQNISMSSFEAIKHKAFKGWSFLCLKLFIKSLENREAVWTLSNSAGLSSDKSLFIGIGFSRFTREKRVSKCTTVMHGARGDKISWKIFPTSQERTITKQWFTNLLMRIRDVLEDERPSRIVFYRTGHMDEIESSAILESISENEWMEKFKVSFISILDGNEYRFYLDGGYYKNIPAGYCFLTNQGEALLSTSNYDDRELKIGTVIPKKLRLEFGEDNILDVAKEYHDLTYLNWNSPSVTPKMPFILRIADKFAQLYGKDVPVENLFYLDM